MPGKYATKKIKSRAPVRRRRDKARANGGSNQAARRPNTLASVQNTLTSNSRGVSRPDMGNKAILDIPYARCRLDPFNSGPSMGLPDSNAIRKLVFDHRAAQDFVVNGSASILILPILPFGAAIKPDTTTAGTITINGSAVTQATSAAINYRWIPICYYPDTIPTDNDNMNPSNTSTHPISSRLRIVGVAYRLVTTSPATSVAGIIQVVSAELPTEMPQVNPIAIETTDPNEGGSVVFAANTVDALMVDTNLSERFQAIVPGTVQMRPEQQPQGVLRHAGPYMWGTMHESPYLPISGQSNGQAFFTHGGGENVGKYGAVSYWDSTFNATRLRITTPSSVAFRLETVVCVEYVMNANSPFARIATPPVKVDTRSVEAVDIAVAKMPAAVTPQQNQNFIQKFIRSVAAAAPIAGMAFGPTGGAIGSGVAAITDALANLL